MNNYLNNYTLTYRQDIDILRGLAVLSVVLYHFAPGRIPGGFLGVDIFFVISGYLITNIILKKDVNNFSFLDFYSRRIKRIFPSLIIVLATFLLLAFFFLSEIDFIQFSKHLSASSIFILNFILINEAGYFDSSSIFKPLLHLWSLSIEEQFYIFWPLLIFLLHKTKSNIFFFSFIVAISSFFFNIFFLKNEIFTFYFPIARFWELLSGSILSVILFSYKKKIIFFSNFTIRLIKFFGYILIIVSFFFIKELKNFYLFFYFATVFGTFLVIFCGSLINIEERSSVFHKILSWFGLISFPLYLWHWPILSFLRIAEGGEIDRSTRVIALFISIFLSWLTYCFVEKKIRFSKNKIMPIILIIFLTLLGVFGYVSFKYRIFNEYLFTKIKFQGDTGHHEFFKYLKSNYYNCNNKILNEFAGSFEGTKRCYESKLNKNIEYIFNW
jgi:peptidoglycan/LPS O-acetylase OafA/YrhL